MTPTSPPFEPCEACQESPGFIELQDGQGIPRLARCPCWRAHQRRIAAARELAALAPREELEA